MICADPPYNLGKNYGKTIDAKEWHEYEDFTIKWLSECKRVLKPTGSIDTFMGVRFIAKLYLILEDMGFFFNGWITWHYTQGMGRTKGFSPLSETFLGFDTVDLRTDRRPLDLPEDKKLNNTKEDETQGTLFRPDA